MLRTSSYTIYVPLPDNEQVLLVHGYTGAYDRVSRNVADYLVSREAGLPSKPLHGHWVTEPALQRPGDVQSPSEKSIELLERRGYLTTMSVDEEEGYFARTTKIRHKHASENGVTYIVMPTYDCNLRCAYCFQDHMRTRPEFKHLLRTVSTTMVDRIVAAMPIIEGKHGVSIDEGFVRRVGFFGGEPLLAVNRSAIEYIITRVRGVGPASFWAVSNATELSVYADLLGDGGIEAIQITLDGPPEEHDKRRIRVDGTGSFEAIAKNIDLCLTRGVRVSVRLNLDRLNIALMPRLAEEIAARGWDQHANFSVYTAPIHAANDKTPMSTTFASTWELDQAMEELWEQHPITRVMSAPDSRMVQAARRVFDSKQNADLQFKTGFCGAHSGMYIFDAFGDIYACWERTGDERIRIGRVLDDGNVETNAPMTRMWRSRTPASNPTCRKCRYAMHCGGGCAVLAEGQGGKFFSNYCDGFGDRFRHAVATAYREHMSGANGKNELRVCDL